MERNREKDGERGCREAEVEGPSEAGGGGDVFPPSLQWGGRFTRSSRLSH